MQMQTQTPYLVENLVGHLILMEDFSNAKLDHHYI